MPSGLTINTERRLYVQECESHGGYSCLGFDNAEARRAAVMAWIEGAPVPAMETGTIEHFTAYLDAMAAGFRHHEATGRRCEAALCPQLIGLENKRVEVVDCYGERRRFNVGRSSGWYPVHLEIPRRNSTGGPAVMGAPFKIVHVID